MFKQFTNASSRQNRDNKNPRENAKSRVHLNLDSKNYPKQRSENITKKDATKLSPSQY